MYGRFLIYVDYGIKLPDFRIHSCTLDRKAFHVSFHKHVEALYSLRIRVQGTALISCKYLGIQEVFQSFISIFIYKIGSQNCDSPCAALTCSGHYRYRCIYCVCQDLLSYTFGLE